MNIRERRIIELLKRNPEGLTQREISNATSMTEATVSKYVPILEAKGKVEIRKIGVSNLVRLKNDV